MNIVCPGCGRRFDPATQKAAALLALGELELQADGTAFRALEPGEERHIDQRVRCDACSFHQR